MTSSSGVRLVADIASRRAVFLDLIASARKSIALSMFRCTDFPVMDALADARARGVDVHLLMTPRAKGWSKKIREIGLYLESMGARVDRFGAQSVKYHAKYMVVDREHAIVSSANLTRKCFERTLDFVLLTAEREVATSLQALFEHDRSAPLAPLPGGLSPRLIIGPERARARFRELIVGARRSIRLVDHRVKDPDLKAALAARKSEGLEVRIHGKRSVPGMRSHGKAMIIDDAVAVIGSISLSPPSLDSRRELAITIDDPAAVATLGAFLDDAMQAAPLEQETRA